MQRQEVDFMTTAIILLVIGIIVNIFIIKWERKEAKTPFIPEWKFDENVTVADEVRAVESAGFGTETGGGDK